MATGRGGERMPQAKMTLWRTGRPPIARLVWAIDRYDNLWLARCVLGVWFTRAWRRIEVRAWARMGRGR